MGGGQSQERVVGVEERPGDGEPQIIITEDFLKHIKDKQGGGDSSSNEPGPQETDEGDDTQFSPTAEQLLMGEDYSKSGVYESEEEDSRWKRKFLIEQQKNQHLKTLNSEAFDSAVNEIRDKFASKTTGNMMPVCEDYRDKVDACYQTNKSRPLLCSNVVREYMECVEKQRKGLLQPPNQQV